MTEVLFFSFFPPFAFLPLPRVHQQFEGRRGGEASRCLILCKMQERVEQHDPGSGVLATKRRKRIGAQRAAKYKLHDAVC